MAGLGAGKQPGAEEATRGTDMKKFLSRLWKDEEGATAVEYGIMVALIALVIIAGVTTLGVNLQTTFNTAGASVPG